MDIDSKQVVYPWDAQDIELHDLQANVPWYTWQEEGQQFSRRIGIDGMIFENNRSAFWLDGSNYSAIADLSTEKFYRIQ